MSTKRLLAPLVAVLVVLMAACSAPQGPSMSAAETGAAIDATVFDAQSLMGSAAWEQLPGEAIGAVSAAALPTGTDGALPRGVYNYDAGADAWAFVSASDDLDLNWTHDAVAYRLLIDWDATSATTWVENSLGTEFEVPTGGAATATQGGSQIASATFTSGWFTNQCAYDEPASASLSAEVGGPDAMLSLDRLAFSITDTAAVDLISAEARISATAGADSLSAYFEANTRGELERDVDCFIVDFAPESGSIAAGVEVRLDGERRSLDFSAAFSDLVQESGMLTSVGLDGGLRVDGVMAVSFAGALNDANSNGIYGDQLQLTFADDQTMTLEEFLVGEVGLVRLGAALLRLGM